MRSGVGDSERWAPAPYRGQATTVRPVPNRSGTTLEPFAVRMPARIELMEIVTAAETLVRLADNEWLHLKDVAQAAAPDVLGTTHAGVTLIRNRGNHCDGLAALREAWGEIKSVTAAQQVSDRFDRLLVRLQMDPCFVMGKRWCAEHQHFGCIHSLY